MSRKVYCIAQFLPKPGQEQALFQVLQALEPNTLREDGCLQYRVTRHIPSPFAEGESFPIVFNEIWQDMGKEVIPPIASGRPLGRPLFFHACHLAFSPATPLAPAVFSVHNRP